ncbi:hypothetical protein AMATHDRAFT_154219 [Amanita thiersii Skay4041]|uniref:CCHC-type domain-containing protein n=1 Tax=Amanita thiersii Skay4041 TaxID=703135 RepID=A0A2A9NFY5_9AGAR|nr:hypothetical protein AMATHDRAFT_154219 [Amanita thiersii Skay4041]
MATPPIYDGSMATCEGFINSCCLYISAKPQEFPNLQIKITWVLGFMQTGMAQLQYLEIIFWHILYGNPGPDQIELLYRDIYKAFGDLNNQAMAIQEITTIKQGSKSVEEHVQLFKQSYMRSRYGETTGIHKFKCSLNSPLLDKCMAIPELPTALDKWYELVIQLDCQWRQASNNLQQGFNQQVQRNWQALINQPQQTQWRPLAQPAQRDPNMMQIDQNRGPIQCYNCGQTSHMVWVCPNP